MTVRISWRAKDPFPGCEAWSVSLMAVSCPQITHPAPCVLPCCRETDILHMMRLAGWTTCEGSLRRWFWDRERVEATCIYDAITDANN